MNFRQRNDPFNLNPFKYVIIDVDGGGDDCQALIALDYYIRKTGKTLLGIVCSNGNVDITNTFNNSLIVQSLCGSSYPLFKGHEQGICGPKPKDFFFGQDGIGLMQGKYLSELKLNDSLFNKQKAYKFIVESALKYRGQVAMICIGPLTNLALAFQYEEQIQNCFSNIVIMGCSDTLAGLHTFYTAEFNIGLDAEAAFIVFSKFKDLVLITLDTSCMAIPEKETEHLFHSALTPKSKFIQEVFNYQYSKPTPLVPTVVDPLAVLVLFCPQIVTQGIKVKVNIGIQGNRTKGCSVIDFFSEEAKNPNSYLIKNFDIKKISQEILKSYV